MTKEKREEMFKYRNEAVRIEIKIKKKIDNCRNITMQTLNCKPPTNETLNLQCSEADSESTIDEYLRVSNLYRQPFAKKNRNMQLNLSNNHPSSANLTKTDTFIYDVVSNTLTNSVFDENNLKRSTSRSSIISLVSNITTAPNSNALSIPTIKINPPNPDEVKCDENSKSIKCSSENTSLIRSNSFTLPSPSTVLLQHIDRQKNQQRRISTATNDTIESKAKKVTKSSMKSLVSIGNISSHRGKKSPYDSKTIKNNRKKTVSLSKCRISSKGTVSLDKLNNVEESHRQRFMELLKKQQEEQKELQTNFEIQQQLFIDELSNVTIANKSETKSPNSDVESSPTFRKSYSDSSEFEKKKPRRKLFETSSPDNKEVKRRVSFQ